MNDPVVAQVILQMFILLLTAKVFGAFFLRLNCPAVVGEFLAGLIWGPSFIQWAFPNIYHFVFPQNMGNVAGTVMGLITLLGFLTMLSLSGSEITLISKKIKGAIFWHTLVNLFFSIVFGFSILLILPKVLVHSNASLFYVGLFLSICLMMSAVPIISRVLNDWGIVSSVNGQFLMLTSICIDFLGWIFLSLGAIIVNSQSANLSLIPLLGDISRMVLGLVLLFVIGYPLMKLMKRKKFDFGFWPVFLGFSAYTHFVAKTNLYLGGLLFGIVTASIPRYRNQLKAGLKGFANEVFTPLFFAMVGHHADLLVFSNINIVLFTIAFLLVGFVVKMIPLLLLKVPKFNKRDFWLISLCLNARGGMEIMVALTGVSLGLFNTQMYTVLVTTAVLTAISCPLVMSWYMNHPIPEKNSIPSG